MIIRGTARCWLILEYELSTCRNEPEIDDRVERFLMARRLRRLTALGQGIAAWRGVLNYVTPAVIAELLKRLINTFRGFSQRRASVEAIRFENPLRCRYQPEPQLRPLWTDV